MIAQTRCARLYMSMDLYFIDMFSRYVDTDDISGRPIDRKRTHRHAIPARSPVQRPTAPASSSRCRDEGRAESLHRGSRGASSASHLWAADPQPGGVDQLHSVARGPGQLSRSRTSSRRLIGCSASQTNPGIRRTPRLRKLCAAGEPSTSVSRPWSNDPSQPRSRSSCAARSKASISTSDPRPAPH